MEDKPLPTPDQRPTSVLGRSDHRISRRDIDPDALKVLYRLHNHGFLAYLVGGAVRDLLLGRKPADFDVGTDAHPNQIKKLFRNAFLIGRRFRLAHIRFQGGKIIEVSTFRKKPDEEELAAEREELRQGAVEAAEDSPLGPRMNPGQSGPAGIGDALPAAADEPAGPGAGAPDAPPPAMVGAQARTGGRRRERPPLRPIAYGSPEEDAFRRDITINALFYDIATFSVIDYVGGLEDLAAGRIRLIGDPDASFVEDPVRIWRVLRHSSRLGFTIDEGTEAAIPRHRPLLAACPGSRLYEELNKDLKSGNSRAFFESARLHAILPLILGKIGELYQTSGAHFERLVKLLTAVDAANRRGEAPAPVILYALLLWPWAEGVLQEARGDKPKALHDSFRECRAAALIPKGLLLDAFQSQAILEHMLEASVTGRMRWGLKKRSHYAAASILAAAVLEQRLAQEADPFERIFQSRYGPGLPERKKRRRRPRRRRPSPPHGP